jgi:hypothetical protein
LFQKKQRAAGRAAGDSGRAGSPPGEKNLPENRLKSGGGA